MRSEHRQRQYRTRAGNSVRPWLRLAGFLLGLLLLRQSLAWLDATLPLRQQQQVLMERHDIEPAALFYTELDVALAGSRSIRQRLSARESPRAGSPPASATPRP